MRTAHDLDEMVAQYEDRFRPQPEPRNRPVPASFVADVTQRQEEAERRRRKVGLLMDEGKDRIEIAHILGISPSTVTEDAKTLGRGFVRGRQSNAHRAKTKASVDETVRLYVEEDMDLEEIAAIVGIQPESVRRRLRQAKVWRGRGSPHVPAPAGGVVGNALTEMSKFAGLILSTDLSGDVPEEEAHARERACREIGKAIAAVRRAARKGTTDGNP